ncbi:putative retrotransposon ty1-copia subclass protein, partial [Tanacetum coccineum]
VHTLMTDEGLVVRMLTEKKYPLQKEIVVQMLKLKLESEEESTMALELIRFIKKNKELSIPEQTATGKGTSNPLMAGYLKSNNWVGAMNAEMQSLKNNQSWCLIYLPPDGRTVESNWLFKKKTDIDGNVHTFKARHVARGYEKTYGVDYEKTFSHVVDIKAIRILLAITAYYDYDI